MGGREPECGSCVAAKCKLHVMPSSQPVGCRAPRDSPAGQGTPGRSAASPLNKLHLTRVHTFLNSILQFLGHQYDRLVEGEGYDRMSLKLMDTQEKLWQVGPGVVGFRERWKLCCSI